MVESTQSAVITLQSCVRAFVTRRVFVRVRAAAIDEAQETAWKLLWHGCPADILVLRNKLITALQQKKIDHKKARTQTQADIDHEERSRLELELGVATYKTRKKFEILENERKRWKGGFLSREQEKLLWPIITSFRAKEKDACMQLKAYFYHLMAGA